MNLIKLKLIVLVFLGLCLTACQLSSNHLSQNIQLKPIQSYVKQDKLYIELLANRQLSLQGNEVFSVISCMSHENQSEMQKLNIDFLLENDNLYDNPSYRTLIQEKSTPTDFFYQIQMHGFMKNKTVFYQNKMSCQAVFNKLIGGRNISNVIQFDMSHINQKQ